MKIRVDRLLVEQGLARSRNEAQALLLAGRVYQASQRIDKAGTELASDTQLIVRGGKRFVSRGGDKLEGALETLDLSVKGAICLDIGASTGGFTDCLLQRGAKRVYAVDVGRGLLDQKLRLDERVLVLENTNARYLTADVFEDKLDWIVVDASFIGLGKLLPAIKSVTTREAQLLALVKPQFEVGRDAAQKAMGVIRDPRLREQAILSVRHEIETNNFQLLGSCDSRLAGPKGNVEHFIWARRL